jgi:hypothetical protein
MRCFLRLWARFGAPVVPRLADVIADLPKVGMQLVINYDLVAK